MMRKKAILIPMKWAGALTGLVALTSLLAHLGLIEVYLTRVGNDVFFKTWNRVTLLFDKPAEYVHDYLIGIGYRFMYTELPPMRLFFEYTAWLVISVVFWFPLCFLLFYMLIKLANTGRGDCTVENKS